MKLKFISLVVAAMSVQSIAAFASDAGVTAAGAPGVGSSTQIKTITNPTRDKVVGTDSTTFERRRETGPMSQSTQVNRITHGGDSNMPIDRMPSGGPLGGAGISTGAKIPGPDGTINHKSELPATKEEVGGGAIGAPGN